MKWDYYTYMSQPTFFVEAVRDYLVKEQRAQLEAIQKTKQKNGR